MNWVAIWSSYAIFGAFWLIFSRPVELAETLGRFVALVFLWITFPVFLGRQIAQAWSNR